MDTSTFLLMDYVQRIKLELKSLANLRVTGFFVKSVVPKGTRRCPTNGPCQQQRIDCRQTEDVASEPGIQRGRECSNVGHLRKRSDDLQKHLAIDPPASNTKCPDIYVRRTPGRTPEVASGPGIQKGIGSSNVGHVCKRSVNLQRRFATDPPASDTNGVRRTSGRTPTASTTLTIQKDVSRSIRNNAHCVEINNC